MVSDKVPAAPSSSRYARARFGALFLSNAYALSVRL